MLQSMVFSTRMALPTSCANARLPPNRPKADFQEPWPLRRRLQQLSLPCLQCVAPVRNGVVPALQCVAPVGNGVVPALDSLDSKEWPEFYEVELKVRDSELDQYGVVNNATYANYCQHGRDELFQYFGFNTDAIATAGAAVAITELSLKYLGPLRSGDRFVVKVKITRFSAARVFFQHYIVKLPNHEPILEAKATGGFLDKNYRPVRIPAEIRSMLAQHICVDESN